MSKMFSRIAITIMMTILWLAMAYNSYADRPILNISQMKMHIVYSYALSKCGPLDIPDAPFRAFRDSHGGVVGIASHYINTELLGSSILRLKTNCKVVFDSAHDVDPSHFDYLTWIASFWTFDGVNIVALGHSEFHGNEIKGGCTKNNLNSCWYNSVVLLDSRDAGKTFSRVDTDKKKPLLAPYFSTYQAEGEPRGYFNPTNIIRNGKYVYAIVGYNGLSKSTHGLCLIRARNPFDIDSWRVFQNGRFVRASDSFYIFPGRPVSECSPLDGLGGVVGSVNHIRGTDWFVATSIEATDDGSGEVDFYYSRDLSHWTSRVALIKLAAFWSRTCGDGYRYNYPSLMDNLGDRNYSDVGRHATLFLTRGNCELSLDRDLVSVTVEITPPKIY